MIATSPIECGGKLRRSTTSTEQVVFRRNPYRDPHQRRSFPLLRHRSAYM